jgi:hypothetical protein
MQERPEIPRLLAWMSLDPYLTPKAMQETAHKLRASLEKGLAGLDAPPGVDPLVFFGVVMAAMDGFFRFREFYSVMTGRDFKSAEMEAAFLDVLIKIAFSKDNKSCGQTLAV